MQGWPEFDIYARLSLDQIAATHEMVERGTSSGRVVLNL